MQEITEAKSVEKPEGEENSQQVNNNLGMLEPPIELQLSRSPSDQEVHEVEYQQVSNPQLVWQSGTIEFGVFPSSCKTFPISFNAWSSQKIEIDLTSESQDGLVLSFSKERRGEFTRNLSAEINPFQQTEMFIQVLVEETLVDKKYTGKVQAVIHRTTGQTITSREVVVQVHQPKIVSPMLSCLTEHGASYKVFNLCMSGALSRQECKLTFKNYSRIPANCDFQIMPSHGNSDLYSLSLLPFRALIKAGEGVTLTLCLRPNLKNFDKEEVDKVTQMRKLMNIRLSDTKVNIVVPLCINFINKSKDELD